MKEQKYYTLWSESNNEFKPGIYESIQELKEMIERGDMDIDEEDDDDLIVYEITKLQHVRVKTTRTLKID